MIRRGANRPARSVDAATRSAARSGAESRPTSRADTGPDSGADAAAGFRTCRRAGHHAAGRQSNLIEKTGGQRLRLEHDRWERRMSSTAGAEAAVTGAAGDGPVRTRSVIESEPIPCARRIGPCC